MAKTATIRQGESIDFSFDRGGDSVENYVCTLYVREFPGGANGITPRVIALDSIDQVWSGFLTSTETAALAQGTWQMIGVLVNSSTDEEQQVAKGGTRFKVAKPWV